VGAKRRKRPLKELELGQVFECPWNGQVGQLVAVSESSATVDLAPKKIKFKTFEGEEVSFKKASRMTWSRETVVETKDRSRYSMK